MTRRQTPILDILIELGVDILFGPDPIQGDVDIVKMKKKVDDQICLWGGVNSYITLESSKKKTVRDSVEYAIQNLASGSGFILGVVDCLTGKNHGTRETPKSSITNLIRTWSKLCRYPFK